MSVIWTYFYLSGRIAFCKSNNCKYQKDFPPQSSTTTFASHLQHNHPDQYKEFKEKCESKKKNQTQQPSIKRSYLYIVHSFKLIMIFIVFNAFASSAPSSSSVASQLDEEIEQITSAKQSKQDIALALRAKSNKI